jgi:CBS domain-containing protein
MCDPDVSLQDAAERMTEKGASSLLVRLAGVDELGILTDQDLRSRVVAEGLPYDTPIGEVMTTPVETVGTEANGSDVLLAMLDHGVRHLPVVSSQGEVLGVISDLDLLAAETRTPFVLRRAIADAQDVDELKRAAGRLNPTLIGLHQFELPPAQISAVISVVADALIRRTIELAIASVGPPPADFAWLSLGSHGRREAVPSSDCDSGIVWAGEADPEHERYMHEVAGQVLATVAATGWESDAHGVTASGPLAAQPAADFQRSLEGWLDHPDDNKVVMAISIVLDSRVVHGPADAFGALAPLEAAGRRKRVLRLLLRLALVDKPPTGFLKNIVVESSGEHRGHFDIKRGGLLPIVDIGRYAAVAAGVTVTPTIERLRAASEEGTLRQSDATTLEEAFDLFSALRLEHQVQQLEAGSKPDNHLDPKSLNPLTRRYLKDAFRAVASVQKTLAAGLTWSR